MMVANAEPMTIERNASIQLRGDGGLLLDRGPASVFWPGRWVPWWIREHVLRPRRSCLDSLLFALL